MRKQEKELSNQEKSQSLKEIIDGSKGYVDFNNRQIYYDLNLYIYEHPDDWWQQKIDGKNPLEYAIDKNKGEALSALFSHVISDSSLSEKNLEKLVTSVVIKAKDGQDKTLLHHAAEYSEDFLEKINFLLTKKVDVNAKDQAGGTPLHYAARHGKNKAQKRLIAAGADLTIQDDQGRLPLSYDYKLQLLNGFAKAIQNGETRAISYTLEENKTWLGVTITKEGKKLTPLQYALLYSSPSSRIKTFKALFYVNFEEPNPPIPKAKILAKDYGLHSGNLAHIAAEHGMLDVLEKLKGIAEMRWSEFINQKNNENSRDKPKLTPLAIATRKACNYKDKDEYLETVKYLLNEGATVSLEQYTPSLTCNALQYSVVKGHTKLVKAFLESDQIKNKINDSFIYKGQQITPIDLAIKLKHQNIANALKEAGAKLSDNKKDNTIVDTRPIDQVSSANNAKSNANNKTNNVVVNATNSLAKNPKKALEEAAQSRDFLKFMELVEKFLKEDNPNSLASNKKFIKECINKKRKTKLGKNYSLVHDIADKKQWFYLDSYGKQGADFNLVIESTLLSPRRDEIIFAAVKQKNKKAVKKLIEFGAKVNVKKTNAFKEYTPLKIALENGSDEITDILLRAGADLKAEAKSTINKSTYLFKKIANINKIVKKSQLIINDFKHLQALELQETELLSVNSKEKLSQYDKESKKFFQTEEIEQVKRIYEDLGEALESQYCEKLIKKPNKKIEVLLSRAENNFQEYKKVRGKIIKEALSDLFIQYNKIFENVGVEKDKTVTLAGLKNYLEKLQQKANDLSGLKYDFFSSCRKLMLTLSYGNLVFEFKKAYLNPNKKVDIEQFDCEKISPNQLKNIIELITGLDERVQKIVKNALATKEIIFSEQLNVFETLKVKINKFSELYNKYEKEESFNKTGILTDSLESQLGFFARTSKTLTKLLLNNNNNDEKIPSLDRIAEIQENLNEFDGTAFSEDFEKLKSFDADFEKKQQKAKQRKNKVARKKQSRENLTAVTSDLKTIKALLREYNDLLDKPLYQYSAAVNHIQVGFKLPEKSYYQQLLENYGLAAKSIRAIRQLLDPKGAKPNTTFAPLAIKNFNSAAKKLNKKELNKLKTAANAFKANFKTLITEVKRVAKIEKLEKTVDVINKNINKISELLSENQEFGNFDNNISLHLTALRYGLNCKNNELKVVPDESTISKANENQLKKWQEQAQEVKNKLNKYHSRLKLLKDIKSKTADINKVLKKAASEEQKNPNERSKPTDIIDNYRLKVDCANKGFAEVKPNYKKLSQYEEAGLKNITQHATNIIHYLSLCETVAAFNKVLTNLGKATKRDDSILEVKQKNKKSTLAQSIQQLALNLGSSPKRNAFGNIVIDFEKISQFKQEKSVQSVVTEIDRLTKWVAEQQQKNQKVNQLSTIVNKLNESLQNDNLTLAEQLKKNIAGCQNKFAEQQKQTFLSKMFTKSAQNTDSNTIKFDIQHCRKNFSAKDLEQYIENLTQVVTKIEKPENNQPSEEKQSIANDDDNLNNNENNTNTDDDKIESSKDPVISETVITKDQNLGDNPSKSVTKTLFDDNASLFDDEVNETTVPSQSLEQDNNFADDQKHPINTAPLFKGAYNFIDKLDNSEEENKITPATNSSDPVATNAQKQQANPVVSNTNDTQPVNDKLVTSKAKQVQPSVLTEQNIVPQTHKENNQQAKTEETKTTEKQVNQSEQEKSINVVPKIISNDNTIENKSDQISVKPTSQTVVEKNKPVADNTNTTVLDEKTASHNNEKDAQSISVHQQKAIDANDTNKNNGNPVVPKVQESSAITTETAQLPSQSTEAHRETDQSITSNSQKTVLSAPKKQNDVKQSQKENPRQKEIQENKNLQNQAAVPQRNKNTNQSGLHNNVKLAVSDTKSPLEDKNNGDVQIADLNTEIKPSAKVAEQTHLTVNSLDKNQSQTEAAKTVAKQAVNPKQEQNASTPKVAAKIEATKTVEKQAVNPKQQQKATTSKVASKTEATKTIEKQLDNPKQQQKATTSKVASKTEAAKTVEKQAVNPKQEQNASTPKVAAKIEATKTVEKQAVNPKQQQKATTSKVAAKIEATKTIEKQAVNPKQQQKATTFKTASNKEKQSQSVVEPTAPDMPIVDSNDNQKNNQPVNPNTKIVSGSKLKQQSKPTSIATSESIGSSKNGEIAEVVEDTETFLAGIKNQTTDQSAKTSETKEPELEIDTNIGPNGLFGNTASPDSEKSKPINKDIKKTLPGSEKVKPIRQEKQKPHSDQQSQIQMRCIKELNKINQTLKNLREQVVGNDGKDADYITPNTRELLNKTRLFFGDTAQKAPLAAITFADKVSNKKIDEVVEHIKNVAIPAMKSLIADIKKKQKALLEDIRQHSTAIKNAFEAMGSLKKTNNFEQQYNGLCGEKEKLLLKQSEPKHIKISELQDLKNRFETLSKAVEQQKLKQPQPLPKANKNKNNKIKPAANVVANVINKPGFFARIKAFFVNLFKKIKQKIVSWFAKSDKNQSEQPKQQTEVVQKVQNNADENTRTSKDLNEKFKAKSRHTPTRKMTARINEINVELKAIRELEQKIRQLGGDANLIDFDQSIITQFRNKVGCNGKGSGNITPDTEELKKCLKNNKTITQQVKDVLKTVKGWKEKLAEKYKEIQPTQHETEKGPKTEDHSQALNQKIEQINKALTNLRALKAPNWTVKSWLAVNVQNKALRDACHTIEQFRNELNNKVNEDSEFFTSEKLKKTTMESKERKINELIQPIKLSDITLKNMLSKKLIKLRYSSGKVLDKVQNLFSVTNEEVTRVKNQNSRLKLFAKANNADIINRKSKKETTRKKQMRKIAENPAENNPNAFFRPGSQPANQKPGKGVGTNNIVQQNKCKAR